MVHPRISLRSCGLLAASAFARVEHHPPQRRRATATPSKNATNSEPSGASRAMLLRMLSGMPGFLPFSIASPTRLAAPLTASDTSAIVDFASGLGSRPSYTSGGEDMSSAMGNLPDQQVVIE